MFVRDRDFKRFSLNKASLDITRKPAFEQDYSVKRAH